MIWPRWLARLLAEIDGSFWIPCPVCKQHFAGFEASIGSHVNHRIEGGEIVSEVTCSKPACVAEARRQEPEFFARRRQAQCGRVIHLRPPPPTAFL